MIDTARTAADPMREGVMNQPPENFPPPTPVPPEVVEEALRSFDEQAIADELRLLYDNGGHTLADFLPELERIVRSRE